MTTKVKGLLKGLRYISQVFDEEKEKDMQIGFPTDVKHVAHIGWDGPSDDNPSWMKEYKSPGAFQSAPLVSPPGDPTENPDIKWVSEDSNSRSRNASSSPTKEKPEKPRTSRRHSTTENGSNENSTNKEPGTKSRSSRRHHNKETSDGQKSSESSSKNNPDIPKKSRRKKSKEEGGSTRPSKSKETSSSSSTTQTTESSPALEGESSGISKETQQEE